ncbi:MAG: hypothetical protein R2798_14170 [Chitinophagales bacterium]|nr:hypothetical protein [Bacteroidota bacterium]MCB9043436.1 hypothetical protein [Chitinophagales bacterium]
MKQTYSSNIEKLADTILQGISDFKAGQQPSQSRSVSIWKWVRMGFLKNGITEIKTIELNSDAPESRKLLCDILQKLAEKDAVFKAKIEEFTD